MPIKRCSTCTNDVPHEYQDRRYGQGVRVFTENGNGESKSCTVCGKKESSSSSLIKKSK